jgi:hypothetical protein
MDSNDQKQRLVAALSRLTRSGKARWARRPIEPEYAFCLAGDELIQFELCQDREEFNPSEPVHGIEGRLGNVNFLWLEGIGGWDELLALIESAPVSDSEFAAILSHAEKMVLCRVESLDAPAGAGEPPHG